MKQSQVDHLNIKLTSLQREVSKLARGQALSPEDRWMSITELMEYLPNDWSIKTIYAYTSKGTMPCRKVGKRLAFLESEIFDWLNESGKKGVKENRKSLEKQAAKFKRRKAA